MAIEFPCAICGATLRVGDDAAGTVIRCGGCMTTLRVPDAPDNSPAPQTPQDEPIPTASYDDESPRPRRRRRPPPAPPGRGPLFWLMMVFGLCVTGCCVCCGGGFLLLPGEKWRSHESARGGFKVDLPATPKENMQIPGMKPDPNLKVEGAILWKRGEMFAVMYIDINPARGGAADEEAILDEAVKGIETQQEIRRIVRKESIKVSGFPGREVEFVATDGGTYVSRVVVADRRLYSLVGGGRFVSPGNANVRRFLDSFEVTDPRVKDPP